MDQRSPTRFLLFFYLAWVFLLMPAVRLSSTMDPEFTIRFIMLGLLTGLLFVVLKVTVFGKNKDSNFSIPMPVFAVFTLILLWTGFSLARSINPGDAWVEWLRLFVCYSFMLVSYFLFRSNQDFIKLLSRFANIAFTIFFLYGAVQLFQAWQKSVDTGSRFVINLLISSSLANKNFFAETVFMLIPLLAYGVLCDSKPWKRIHRTNLFLAFAMLIILQSVSTWLAVFVSVILMLAIQWPQIRKGRSWQGAQTTRFFVIGLVASGLVFFVYSRTNNFRLLKKKIALTANYLSAPNLNFSGVDQKDNSTYERMLAWRNSLLMIREYPVLGAGLNNWKIIHPKYGFGGTSFLNGGMVHFEHPHNDYLLVWAEQGIPGILVYTLSFILILRLLFRKLKKDIPYEKRVLLLCMLGGITGFMVMSCLGYPRSRMFSMILLMIDFAIVLAMSDTMEGRPFLFRRFGFTVVTLIIVAGSCIAVYAGADRLQGEIHTKQMMIAQFGTNFARMKREADRSENYFYPVDLTSTPIEWYKGMAWYYSGNIPNATNYYRQAYMRNPYHLRVLNDLGSSLEKNGQRDSAIIYYKLALAITPLFVEGLLNISAAYFNEHQVDSAYRYIDRAYGLPMRDPNTNTYAVFLRAILFAKGNDSLFSVSDTLCRLELREEIGRTGFLEKTYLDSKEKRQPFLQALYSKCKSK